MRAFERYVEDDRHAFEEREVSTEGIQNKERAWQGNQFLSPFLDRCIKKFQYDTIEVVVTVCKALPLYFKEVIGSASNLFAEHQKG